MWRLPCQHCVFQLFSIARLVASRHYLIKRYQSRLLRWWGGDAHHGLSIGWLVDICDAARQFWFGACRLPASCGANAMHTIAACAWLAIGACGYPRICVASVNCVDTLLECLSCIVKSLGPLGLLVVIAFTQPLKLDAMAH